MAKPLPVTAGHCLPATPARLFLLIPVKRPHRATFGRQQMTCTVTASKLGERTASGSILSGWVRRGDLARELGLTEDTLRRWEERRTGPACVRAGRKVLYRRSAIEAWLAEQEWPQKVLKSRGRR